MATLTIVSMENQPVGEVTLSDRVFGGRVNGHLLWESARQARAKARRGTAKTKTRAEVSGAGRKLWRQKGTGRARVGSIRTPIWRHGGTVHGPQPRDYAYQIPKKARAGAMRSALSQKVAEGNLVLLSELVIAASRTKEVKALLGQLGIAAPALLVTADPDPSLALATRNIPGTKASSASRLTVYDILAHEKLVVTQEAAQRIEEAYAR